MSGLRRRSFWFIVPLLVAMLLPVPLALATLTTGTGKTLGGFTGGTIPLATTFTSTTTFSSAATFNAVGNVFNGYIQLGQNVSIADQAPQAVLYANRTTLTPDGPALMTTTLSNSWHLGESADIGNSGFDMNNGPCGAVACTDPNFIVHSAVQDTVQYTALAAGVVSSKAVKTLTESTPTAIWTIPITTLTGTGGTFDYCVLAADASVVQHRCGWIKWNAVNVADTETCNMTTVAGATDASIAETEDGSGSGAISSGTLTYAVTCAGGTNSVIFSINAVSSLTQTTLQAEYSVLVTGRGQAARQ